jgi:conjugal transfer mating pair stabilization protein TraG
MLICSFGGGEVLYFMLSGVAQLANSPIMQTITHIMAGFGLCIVAYRTSISGNIMNMISGWFIPFLLIYSLFIMPRTNVAIKDVIQNNEVRNVSNVPLGLALVARMTSSLGYSLTEIMETIFHNVSNNEENNYSKTGRIFGADNILDMNQYMITDSVLDRELYDYATWCTAYDAGLGKKFTWNEFLTCTDISKILEKSSTKRGIFVVDNNIRNFYTCKEAGSILNRKIQSHAGTRIKTQAEIYKRLPHIYQFFTQSSQNAEQIVAQQMLIGAYSQIIGAKKNSLGIGGEYAYLKTRANQNNTMQLMGRLGGNAIVAIRSLIETILIASFLFIMPMITMPTGLMLFGSWIKMMIWINLWPPLYVIVNYIVQLTAKTQGTILLKLYGGGKGISIASSASMASLYNDLNAYSGYAILIIPALSWMIIQGSFAGLVGLASSMMSSSQSIAQGSSAESLSGNYSYGNMSMGNSNFNNHSQNKISRSAMIENGFGVINTGVRQVTISDDGTETYRIQGSQLPLQAKLSNAVSNQFSESLSNEMQKMESYGKGFNKSISLASSQIRDNVKTLSSNKQYSNSISQSDGSSYGDSARSVQSTAESFAKTHNMSTDEAYSAFVAAEISGGIKIPKLVNIGGAGGGRADYSSRDSDAIEDALRVVQDESFAKNWDQVKQFNKSSQETGTNDISNRSNDTINTTYSNAESYLDSYNVSLNESERYSSSINHLKSIGGSLDQDGGDRFIRYISNISGEPIANIVDKMTDFNFGKMNKQDANLYNSEMNTYWKNFVDAQIDLIHPQNKTADWRAEYNNKEIQKSEQFNQIRGKATDKEKHEEFLDFLYKQKNDLQNEFDDKKSINEMKLNEARELEIQHTNRIDGQQRIIRSVGNNISSMNKDIKDTITMLRAGKIGATENTINKINKINNYKK